MSGWGWWAFCRAAHYVCHSAAQSGLGPRVCRAQRSVSLACKHKCQQPLLVVRVGARRPSGGSPRLEVYERSEPTPLTRRGAPPPHTPAPLTCTACAPFSHPPQLPCACPPSAAPLTSPIPCPTTSTCGMAPPSRRMPATSQQPCCPPTAPPALPSPPNTHPRPQPSPLCTQVAGRPPGSARL